MSNLKLSANYIENTGAHGFHWGHLQIVYGTQEIEVQSPPSIQNWNGLTNFTYPVVRPHAAHTDGIGTDGKYESVNVDIGDRDAGDVWDILVQVHEQFVDRHPNFLYGLGQNSNSYVNTLLWMVGIDVQDHITEVRPENVIGPDPDEYNVQLASEIFGPPIFGDPDFWTYFPGVDRNVLTDGYGLTGSLVFSLEDLAGTEGNDFLRTGKGDDSFSAGDGDDTYFAGEGRDTLIGGRGSDILDGGEGSDTVEYAQALDDTVDDRSNGIVAQLDHTGSGTVVDGLGGTDTLSSIETVGGTQFDDVFKFQGSFSSFSTSDLLVFDAMDGANETSGDTIDLSGVAGQGVYVSLDTKNDVQFATSSGGEGTPDSSNAEIILNGFENVNGSDFNDVIIGDGQNNILKGGDGADELRGGDGDDTLYFDADDTVVDGGEGRDTAIVEGTEGVTLNLDDANVEIAVGGEGNDTFYLSGGQMAAGGKGIDTFHIQEGGSGPVIIFGGDDKDVVKGATRIVTVEVDGLTEENFAEFTLDMVNADIDWSEVDAVILNPGSEDRYYWDGDDVDPIKVQNDELEVKWSQFRLDDATTEGENAPNPELTFDFFSYEGITPLDPNNRLLKDTGFGNIVFSASASFLGSSVNEIQTSVVTSYGAISFIVDGNGNPSFPEWFDQTRLAEADFNAPHEWRFGDATPEEATDAIIYFWYPDDFSDFHASSGSNVKWFVAGGKFAGDTLVSDGSITATMPDVDPPEQVAANTEVSVEPGNGNKSLSGFEVTSSTIVISGVPIDPNTPPAGVTVSQQNNNVAVGYGNNEVITLLNVSLTDWQAAASSQVLGTDASETLTGTTEGETIAAGNGNDVIKAGNGGDSIFAGSGNDTVYADGGDDTIAYHSGNDVIRGHHSAGGQDTLDLSKYTSDQVSFSNNGASVLIATPDGTITLHFQNYYDIGHGQTNIETVVFSDGTLDEAGIRDRALHDLSTSGDDTINGTRFGETILDGAGNDTIKAENGDDTIIYHSGNDVIRGHHSAGGQDTLDLSKYTSDQVSFSNSGGSVLIETPDGTITLTFQNYYDIGHGQTNIETVVFSDGTLDEAGIRDRALHDLSTSGDDTIKGTRFGETILDGAGNDTIKAENGDDTIIYHSGNDVIHGHHSAGGQDTLDLSKYTSDQVSFSNNGGSVLIETPDGTITLTYQNSYDIGHGQTNIETVVFSDGTLDEVGIRDRSNNDIATDGADTLVGTKWADRLDGGAGADILTGGNGADTFVFKNGSGDDRVTDFEDGVDLLSLEGTGLAFADLVISDSAEGAVVDLAGQGSITLIGVNSTLITEDDFQFI
ncbi:calcium-binding protein [Ruegeria arenilitoris]|uniref:calcium-binding protein n=1 Tax=Ruegeria arenilitoris TaxID=1173585 RepID=UPI00147EB4F8|nr:calcium-binding protein [Ruegeria arenilitoris]